MTPTAKTRSAQEDSELRGIFKRQSDPSKFAIFKTNSGKMRPMKMLPNPPGKMPVPDHVKYDSKIEPKFDAAIHLSLEQPKSVAIFDKNENFQQVDQYKCEPSNNGSSFAYCDPFQLFSEEGSRVGRMILNELKKSALDNGRSVCFRSIWHISPFFKDMMSSSAFLDHVSKICGEPVLPHFYLYNAQINVGKVGADGPVDQWHFDSVGYVCVTLLSDIEGMKGGQLELVKHPKDKAINMVINGTYTNEDLIQVSYDKTGKCIMCQGSKIIHHVTKVESAKEDRISLIISLTPANAYHPDRTVYHSMFNLDCNAPKGVAQYEFWRQKAWHCKEILEDYATNQTFTKDSKALVAKLRAVSEELDRVSNLLEGKETDKIGFFSEKKGKTWL